MASTSTLSNIVVPDGFRIHTENSSHIMLSKEEAFLNPVQEFNRDLSIACIRVWSEELSKAKEEKWKKAQTKKQGTTSKSNGESVAMGQTDVEMPFSTLKVPKERTSVVHLADTEKQRISTTKVPEYRPYKFVLLEALSATGLRAIRYAKEIPLAKYIIANDLSPVAVGVMKRNVELNGLGGEESSVSTVADAGASLRAVKKPKVIVNEGDACSLMYNHREEKNRVDVVDLDPYGTAGPFIDAAVQCVNDGGLLCVTCTDLAVLATTNFPEKCYSNYGGVPVKTEYSHEVALRLLLHTLSTSASRYGRYIEPMLSLSIDFYIRIFVKVHTQPIEVKKALSKNSTFYVCTNCQSHYEQPLGRMVSKAHEASGNINILFKTQAAVLSSDKCPECDSHLHIAGPMWSAPLHDPVFVEKVVHHVEESKELYGTAARMKGMLTLAKEELPSPFYFTPSRVASFFHCQCPSLDDVCSALLNAGYQVSRSHACAGSLKTTASRAELHDLFRSWIKLHPVKIEKISETSPAVRLLAKENAFDADFTRHPRTLGALEMKLVRYQENPSANWGPGRKASKRKRSTEVLDEPPAKH
ncbi:N2,N2-dimethylguanosine tRNA methyltransferase [Crepidotus variabilis]|uniref:tRNA (guanine(26)-N(2))-dimethyltransferase n=1 Tax=Crepidotus variabilis TaxID=179855 RepID=A0A9P6JWQ4_9AGAR|nr:N2,N2-dimethylguanosine tRNA methyltransferase [Crepidotus variabilis]